jgi:hypothetical protein
VDAMSELVCAFVEEEDVEGADGDDNDERLND